MSWSKVEPLDGPQYEELSSITRSLHLQQAQSSHVRKKLTSHKIGTRNVKVKAKVLWFAPTKPMNQNNMYGNVSFTLDWSNAMDEFGPYLYYIDQKENPDIIYSRVLLTNKCYSSLTPVNTNEMGMPLRKLGQKYHVATACDGVMHVVEIGIEADAKRGKRLYANCKIQVNDHSSANKKQNPRGPYNPCTCHRFNYFRKVCPSPYTAQQTRAWLNKQFPTMLRDAPSWNHAQVVLEKFASFDLESSVTEVDDDENDYEDGEYIVTYDDHETVSLCNYSVDDGEGSSYFYGSGGHGRTQTGEDSSDDDSYGNARASRFRHTATRNAQDEGWGTGSKVALVAGGLALFAGLAAAAFAADSAAEDKKKKNGGSEWK